MSRPRQNARSGGLILVAVCGLLLAPSLVARPSSAIQVAIEYGFASSTSFVPLSTLLGGNPITGLSAVVVADLSGTGTGGYLTGAAVLTRFTLATAGAATLAFPVPDFMLDNVFFSWTGFLPLAPGATKQASRGTHFVGFGTAITGIYANFIQFSNTITLGIPSIKGNVGVAGTEVSRTLVPEPSLAWLALGLAAAAGTVAMRSRTLRRH